LFRYKLNTKKVKTEKKRKKVALFVYGEYTSTVQPNVNHLQKAECKTVVTRTNV